MKKIIAHLQRILLLFVIPFTSCQQNPYPKEGELSIVQRPELRAVKPPLSLALDDILEIYENNHLEYKIRASVQDPGVPVVTVENLPAGAEFDSKNFVLKWRPSFFDGNDVQNPAIKSRIYPVTVWLRNSLDPVTAIKKTINLLVHDTPRIINVVFGPARQVIEGTTFSNTFTIRNDDFPKGPFKVLISEMPANMELIKIDENTYKLQFTPDYSHLNLNTYDKFKVYRGKIIIAAPSNYSETKDLEIRVDDKRLTPKVIVPSELTQGLDASFQVVGHDLNQEMSPVLTMVTPEPPFGTFSFQEIKNTENHSTVLNILWSDIPPTHNGEEFLFRFQSCVQKERGYDFSICSTSTSKLKINLKNRKPPAIGRKSWPAGEFLYLRQEEYLERIIPITDSEDPNLVPKIEIFPEAIRSYVKYDKGKLILNFKSPGIFQFNLKATSDYNVSSMESFLVEIFPSGRNKTLFFADSTRDPEVVFYRKSFKNVDIMNPALQDIDSRTLSGRETLIIGTSSLLDKELAPTILKGILKIKNIVVASPLISQLPEAFLDDLKHNYGLVAIGRYSELPNLPPLEKMQFAKTSQFKDPVNPVFLKRSASSESKDPMLFNGGLYEPDKLCKGVLGLSLNGTNPYVIGVVCNRKEGGRIVLLGTEWADLLVTSQDEQIPFEWFSTTLKGKF